MLVSIAGELALPREQGDDGVVGRGLAQADRHTDADFEGLEWMPVRARCKLQPTATRCTSATLQVLPLHARLTPADWIELSIGTELLVKESETMKEPVWQNADAALRVPFGSVFAWRGACAPEANPPPKRGAAKSPPRTCSPDHLRAEPQPKIVAAAAAAAVSPSPLPPPFRRDVSSP